jgi:cystathionine beta-synthase
MKKEFRNSILDFIGETPLVQLQKLSDPDGANVLAKVEYMNPGGSLKDRIAIEIIEEAERTGKIKPGGTIVEGTSGNTGLGLALVAAVKGYKSKIVVTDKQSQEKIWLLKSFGAEVIIVPSSVGPESPDYYVNTARRIAKETPNSLLANQFFNPVNPETHYKFTGPEIWRQAGGKVDAFVSGMGTGGTITGVGRFLKEKNPNVRIVGADPYGSELKLYKETGKLMGHHPYLVEGIGNDMVPGTLNLEYIDEIINVSDQDSFNISRRLTREEGIFCGGSSGTAVHVALEIAKTMPKGANVVAIVADTGERYLTKHHSDEWMKEQRMMRPERLSLDLINKSKDPRIPVIISVEPSQSLKEAFKVMNEYGISQVPVLDNGKSVGSLKEREALAKIFHNTATLDTQVCEIMDNPFPELKEDATLIETITTLKENTAVLIKKGKSILGIVTRFDIMDYTSV